MADSRGLREACWGGDAVPLCEWDLDPSSSELPEYMRACMQVLLTLWMSQHMVPATRLGLREPHSYCSPLPLHRV